MKKRNELLGMDRRGFLSALTLATSYPLVGAQPATALAMDGGGPVRTTPLTTHYEGANFINDAERTEVVEVVESRNLFRFYGFSTPKKVRTFEEEFQKFLGVNYALAVTSGTAALHVALLALGVGPGDEVILPALTWYSCYNAIIVTGALPIFAEIDESLTINPEDLKKKISPHTKVVMAVDLSGNPANWDHILPIARQHGLKVLEDSAQSCGALYKGKRTGTFGDIGIFSFQINKMISSGEGGAVVTNAPELYERAIRYHDLGEVRPLLQGVLGKNEPTLPTLAGLNYRMNEESGAIMCAQLRRIETVLSRHREMYRFVTGKLEGLSGISVHRSNDADGDIGISLDLFLPNQDIRDKFVRAMTAENVPMGAITTSVVLPIAHYIETKQAPHPRWPSFDTERGKSVQYGAACCPETVELHKRIATLSIGPKYSDGDLNDLVAAVKKVHGALIS